MICGTIKGSTCRNIKPCYNYTSYLDWGKCSGFEISPWVNLKLELDLEYTSENKDIFLELEYILKKIAEKLPK